jgi:GT2 family glycosyltransferase
MKISETSGKIFCSFLILTRNRFQGLLTLIKSIVTLKGFETENFEILILDNGSDEKLSNSILKDLTINNLHIIISEKNIGLAAGRNLLGKEANGEWLFFIDDDAFIPEENFLFTFRNFLEKHNNNRLAIVACNIIEYYKPWKNLYPFSKKYLKKINLKEPVKCSYFLGGAHFIKRDVFLKLNGYDEKLFFWGEELDFSYKVINNGYEIYYNPDLLVIHKSSGIKHFDKRREHYYFIRNKIYLNHKYLPWYLRWVSNTIWLFVHLIQTKSISILFEAIIDAHRMSKNTKRDVLSIGALKYLFVNYGRLFY